jgi:hypothetical protein
MAMANTESTSGGGGRGKVIAAAILGAILGGLVIWLSMDVPGAIRVRFFNGVDAAATRLKVEPYRNENKSGAGPVAMFDQSAQLEARDYNTHELDDQDYARMDVSLKAGDEWVTLKTFKASEVAGGGAQPGDYKIHTIEISRRKVAENTYKHHIVVTYGPWGENTPNKCLAWDET